MSLNTAQQKIEFFEVHTPEEFVIEAGLDTTLTDKFFSMMRSLQWLHNQARHYRGGGQNKISYRDANRRLKSVTKYQFIMTGLPKMRSGLKQILNLKNQDDMIIELHRLEAIVSLTCIGHVKYENVTEEMINDEMRTIISSVQAGRGRGHDDGTHWWTVLNGANDYSKAIGA